MIVVSKPAQTENGNLDGDSRFAMIDHERGTLRLLIALEAYGQGLSRTQLTDKLREQGIGRTSLKSSLESCKELGLLVDVKMQRGSSIYTITMLSEQGYLLALKLLEIKKMLDDNWSHAV